MAKKSKAKKSVKTEENIQTRKWEDLEEIRNEIINEVLTPHTFLYELHKKHKDVIEKDKELSKLVVGLDENFKDLIEEVKAISSTHSTIENGTHVCRKGEISNQDVDNILTYDDIYGKYLVLSHKVIENGQKGILNLTVNIAEKNKDFDTAVIYKKEIEKIDQELQPLTLVKTNIENFNKIINNINNVNK